MSILEVQNLRVSFPVTGGVFARKVAEVKAVDGVSFALEEGETLGLVGESGCGKSTVGRAIINILRTMVYGVEISGNVIYRHEQEAVNIATLSRNKMRPYRPDIQMIFQDPYSSLNPRMTVGQIVENPLRIHSKLTAGQRKERVRWLLGKVGFTQEQMNRYPHEFSGGQRQRIGIARVNLMQDLQDEFKLSYLFIAHDLSVVRHISDRIAVMYLGNIVEIGPAELIYSNPMHPYSRALLSAVPRPDPEGARDRRIRLSGDVPNPINKPSGCAFRTRCPIARPSCADAVPPLEFKEGRWVACPWV
jgi:oligopeptide/dipeptide ABC transporter ATP-binding protein